MFQEVQLIGSNLTSKIRALAYPACDCHACLTACSINLVLRHFSKKKKIGWVQQIPATADSLIRSLSHRSECLKGLL
jgi:hypothetical protein